jgi:DNA-binding IscR family transcriptional regulator
MFGQVAMGIVTIDMHIRDERVLAYIKEKAGADEIPLPADEIANRFKCHLNTAQAILKRLRCAKHIEIVRAQKRGGFIYRVINA